MGGGDNATATVGLVGVDLTPSPGLKQPYNFLGHLSRGERARVKELLEEAADTTDRVSGDGGREGGEGDGGGMGGG